MNLRPLHAASCPRFQCRPLSNGPDARPAASWRSDRTRPDRHTIPARRLADTWCPLPVAGTACGGLRALDARRQALNSIRGRQDEHENPQVCAGNDRFRRLDRDRPGRCRRNHRLDRHEHQGRCHGAVHRQRVELQQDADRADGLLPAHQRCGRDPRAQVRDDCRRHRLRPGQGDRRRQEAAPPGRGLLPARQLLQRRRHGREADGRAHRHPLDHRARGQSQHLHAGDRAPEHLPRRPGRPGLRLHHGRVRHEQARREAHRDGHPHQRLGEVVLRPRHRGHHRAPAARSSRSSRWSAVRPTPPPRC